MQASSNRRLFRAFGSPFPSHRRHQIRLNLLSAVRAKWGLTSTDATGLASSCGAASRSANRLVLCSRSSAKLVSLTWAVTASLGCSNARQAMAHLILVVRGWDGLRYTACRSSSDVPLGDISTSVGFLFGRVLRLTSQSSYIGSHFAPIIPFAYFETGRAAGIVCHLSEAPSGAKIRQAYGRLARR